MTDSPSSPSTSPCMAELLSLEQIDGDLYRGVNEIPANGRTTLYGGQIAAQALMAAGLTVSEDRYPHSLHSYFLRPGLTAQPVVFRVDRDRDGRSFSARRVTATQNGKVIFDLTASFHIDEPGGVYEVPMPAEVPLPDECGIKAFTDNFPVSEAKVVPPTIADDDGVELSSTFWVRIRERLSDDRLTQACALLYLSDIGTGFLSTEQPGLPRGGPSLDHAMWLRDPIRADDWVLLHMWPLMAGGSRGLYAGSMHQVDGTVGAMITQESLLRQQLVMPGLPDGTKVSP